MGADVLAHHVCELVIGADVLARHVCVLVTGAGILARHALPIENLKLDRHVLFVQT
jgi:hypothetical protein